jgi:phosphoglycolate phosphatase-like HAD superfamily hydrolase
VVLGRRVDMATMRTAGLTDAEIALELVRGQGDGDPRVAGQLLDEYARRLPDALPRRKGHVLPNVRENLEALSTRDDVINMLLTGNVARGAEAKLRHYGLWEFFGAGGAFSVEGSDRPSIAERARELAAKHGGEMPSGEQMVVIGDTPCDVACGKAIGARTVAVASGPVYSLEELRASEPWVALEAMPEPRVVQRLLGIDGSG